MQKWRIKIQIAENAGRKKTKLKNWWGGNTYDYLKKDFIIRQTRIKVKCAIGDTSHNKEKLKRRNNKGTKQMIGDRRGKRKKRQGEKKKGMEESGKNKKNMHNIFLGK